MTPIAALPKDVRVDHGGANVRMAQQFLNRADIAARLEKMRGKAMAKRMATRRLHDARALRTAACTARWMAFSCTMVANRLSGIRILTKDAAGKYVLPTPLLGVVRKFLRQRRSAATRPDRPPRAAG